MLMQEGLSDYRLYSLQWLQPNSISNVLETVKRFGAY